MRERYASKKRRSFQAVQDIHEIERRLQLKEASLPRLLASTLPDEVKQKFIASIARDKVILAEKQQCVASIAQDEAILEERKAS